MRTAAACAAAWLAFTSAALAQVPIRTYADGFTQRFDPADPEVRYVVAVPDQRGAYIVAMTVRGIADSSLRLALPNWAPGAYRITNAWRRLSAFTAHDSAGRPLGVLRPDSLTWLVQTSGSREVTVRYAVEAVPSPNNRHYLAEHTGLIDGPSTFLYLQGRQQLPAHVRLTLPPGWRAGTGLTGTPDSSVFFAATYDVLIDAPTLVGRFQRWLFTAAGVPHQVLVANDGRPAPFDTLAFVDVVRRLTEAGLAVFGGRAPYRDYTYIYVMGAGGGLEHLNSTTIGLNSERMAQDVRSAASVTAHEFFHTWNVKRIRPAILGPFDYTSPQRTTDLWVAEGWTSYYGGLLQLRSGVITRDGYRRIVQNLITAHQSNPAHTRISPERSSWTTWDPPAANGGYSISYYNQGQQLGLLLDIAMRDSTDNRRGMDDLMRLMFARFGGDRGYTSQDLLHTVNSLTGRDFHDFFRHYVSGAEEIPWNDYLRRIGWDAEIRDSVVPVDRRIAFVPPGQQFGAPGPMERWRVSVEPGTAFHDAGLRTGDVLVSLNGTPVGYQSDPDGVVERLAPGQALSLVVTRQQQRLEVRVTGRPYQTPVAAVEELSSVPPRALAIRESIMSGSR